MVQPEWPPKIQLQQQTHQYPWLEETIWEMEQLIEEQGLRGATPADEDGEDEEMDDNE